MSYQDLNFILRLLTGVALIGAVYLVIFSRKGKRKSNLPMIVLVIIVLMLFVANLITNFHLSETWETLGWIICLLLSVFMIQESRLTNEKIATHVFIETFAEILEEQTGKKVSEFESTIKKKVEDKNVASFFDRVIERKDNGSQMKVQK